MNLPSALSYVKLPSPPASRTFKCCLVSAGLGPVYVNWPAEESYTKLPSPPASTIESELLTLGIVK